MGFKILKNRVKNISTNSSTKIFGNPNLNIDKKIIIKNYLKDHRVFMTSVFLTYHLVDFGKFIIKTL